MRTMVENVKAAVWTDPEAGAPSWQRPLQKAGRVLWLAVEGFLADSCSLRASALTLASLMALVPALAVSFAYVRGLGWTGQRLESLLLQKATILSPEAVTTVVSWIDHISIAGLGLMGALFAIGSSISLLFQIEHAFDAVWGNPHGRDHVRRAADALVLLVFAPMVVAVAASSEAALRASPAIAWMEGFGGLEILVRVGFAAAWYAMVCAGFTALYLFLPAAPVQSRAALVGGVAVGLSWRFAQSLYLDFQFGLDGYNAVYGALAQLPMLVFWMWTSWALILLGAEIAAAVQNLEACGRRFVPRLAGASSRERLSLAIAIELADAAFARREAPTLAELATQLAMPVRSVSEVFSALQEAGLAHTGGDDQRRCFLSLSPGSIAVERVVASARGAEDADVGREKPVVARVLADFAAARSAALGKATLADLVDPAA